MDIHPWIVIAVLVGFGIYRLVTVPWSADDPRTLVSTIIFVIAGSVGYTVLYYLTREQSQWGDVVILAAVFAVVVYMIYGIIKGTKRTGA